MRKTILLLNGHLRGAFDLCILLDSGCLSARLELGVGGLAGSRWSCWLELVLILLLS